MRNRSPRAGHWPTMQDVARRAGVSAMTVSRALAAPEKVDPTTRARIRDAVRELGYVPDRLAGGLSSRRSGLIAALVSTLTNSIFAPTVDGLTAAVRRAGYEVLLGSTDYSIEGEEALIAAALSRRPDGLVLTGTIHTSAARELLRNAAVPVVETWDLPENPIDMTVGFSNIEAGRAMTHWLHEFGYRRIAFIGTAGEGDSRGQLRAKGYRRAMAELGLGQPVVITTGGGAPGLAEGAAALARLGERYPEADAVFCVSDIVAAGAILECRRRGVAVPQRLAIAGFGDFDLASEAALDLTTVRIPGFVIGERAGQMLIERIEGRSVEPKVVDVGFDLVRRQSA
ncbi:MAG TPA: LacI family DNA-binding transcriptional regulator [Geminicoccaceae bacterium]|nr:LacI family DNA-binding transcriptional regulator [Geminicoccaceae bacterium]